MSDANKRACNPGQSIYFKGSLGDAICLLPVLEALATRCNSRVLAAGEYFEDLLKNSPHAKASLPTSTPIIFRHQKPGETQEHLIDFFARLAQVEVMERSPQIYLTSADAYETAGFSRIELEDRPVVAIDPQAGWPNREWGYRNYDALVRELARLGYAVIQVGKPFTNCFGDPVDVRLAEADTRFYGALSIRQTADLLSQCACFVGNDSGLAHLAAAVQTPAVVLFGPVHPLFRCHAWTLPLFHDGCPGWHETHTTCVSRRRCMDSIKLGEVLQLVRFAVENRALVPKASQRIVAALAERRDAV